MICPICSTKRLLVEHHIHGRQIPNANASWNRVWLCVGCHEDIHTNPPKIIIEGWVSTSEGKILAWRKNGESQNCLEGAKPYLYGEKTSEAL